MFTDEHDIERELTAALGVQPSSGFEARVLLAAADGSSARRSRWSWLGAAAAVMLIAGIWAVSGGTRLAGPERMVTRIDPPPVVEPRPEPESQAASTKGRAAAPTRPQQRPAGGEADSQRLSERAAAGSDASLTGEVLVPANQLALITAFAQEVQRGRVALPDDADPEARLQTLVVPRVTIQPIAVATLEPGASGPGSKGLHQ